MNCCYAFFTKDTKQCIYVGSSKNFFLRYGKHLVDSQTGRQQYKLYSVIREKGGWKNIEYVILEENIEGDLLIKEKEYYLSLKPIGNRQSPFQTPEERAIQIREKNIKHRETRLQCPCGANIRATEAEKHSLTKRHIKWSCS